MCWFKTQNRTYRHEKTLRLAEVLDISKYEAAGYLLALWGSVYDMRPDGDLRGLSRRVLASMVELAHRADEFVQALIDVRLVDVDEDGSLLKIHNAERYTERHRRTQQRRALRDKARQKLENKTTAPGKKATAKPRSKPKVVEAEGTWVEATVTNTASDLSKSSKAPEPARAAAMKADPVTALHRLRREITTGVLLSSEGRHRDHKVKASPTWIRESFNQAAHVWGLRKAPELTDDMRDRIWRLIKADTDRRRLSWWQGVFDELDYSRYLRGEADGHGLGFEWLMQEANLMKVYSGHYRDHIKEADRMKIERVKDLMSMTPERRNIFYNERTLVEMGISPVVLEWAAQADREHGVIHG